jgi:quercetin dioxygenase-like cupin family protein
MEKTAVRLMKLDAGAIIKPHSDHKLNFEEGEVRLHIPVVTNPQVKFYLEAERLVMEAGSCWYLNLARQHEVINDGPTARIHLVIDGLVNDWLAAYFHNGAHRQRAEALPPLPPFSPDDQRRIIAQLRHLRTATADALADEMEAALTPLKQ